MSNPYFRFKQFTVFHDKCAMKVGTDGVLIGAWTNVQDAAHILDVGTGTGLIALMVAQRNPNAKVVAIDVDDHAVEQAIVNIKNSPFPDRITVASFAFQEFAQQNANRFDLIVTNPPYFSDSLMPSDEKRARARHSISLTLDELLHCARMCLGMNGILSIILPYDKSSELESLCKKHMYFVKRKTIVYPLPDNEPKRILTELALAPVVRTVIDSLTIEVSRRQYTDEFISLAKDFYLTL